MIYFYVSRLFFNILKKGECRNFFTGRSILSKPTFVPRNPSLFNTKSCKTPPVSVSGPVPNSNPKCDTSIAEPKTTTHGKLPTHKHNQSQTKYEKPVHDVSGKSVFSENQKSKKPADPVISKSNNETSLKKCPNQIPNPKKHNKLINPISERKLIKSTEVFQNTHKASSTVNSTKPSAKSSKVVDPWKSKNTNSNEGKVREKSKDKNTDEKAKSTTKEKTNEEKKHIEQHNKSPKSAVQVKKVKNPELKSDTKENNTKIVHRKTPREKSIENINPSMGSKSTENQKKNNETIDKTTNENSLITNNSNYADCLQQLIAISVEKLKLFIMKMFKRN